MEWLRLDARFALHRKIEGLTDGAFRRHVTALCHAAIYSPRDGYLSAASAQRIAGRYLPELERAGLWDALPDVNGAGGGWVLHDWQEAQPHADQVERHRQRSAERSRRYRQRHGQDGDA